MLRPPVRHVNKNPMTMIIMLAIFAYCYAATVFFVYLRKIIAFKNNYYRSKLSTYNIEYRSLRCHFGISDDDNFERPRHNKTRNGFSKTHKGI